MLTNFGKFCRKLRIDNGKLLLDMARELGVSSAFLSKVENGKAKPPVEWNAVISNNYNLTEGQKRELAILIEGERSKKTVKIPDISEDDSELMLAFARKLGSMSESDKINLRKKFDI